LVVTNLEAGGVSNDTEGNANQKRKTASSTHEPESGACWVTQQGKLKKKSGFLCKNDGAIDNSK
jgi:hypothetical protein